MQPLKKTDKDLRVYWLDLILRDADLSQSPDRVLSSEYLDQLRIREKRMRKLLQGWVDPAMPSDVFNQQLSELCKALAGLLCASQPKLGDYLPGSVFRHLSKNTGDDGATLDQAVDSLNKWIAPPPEIKGGFLGEGHTQQAPDINYPPPRLTPKVVIDSDGFLFETVTGSTLFIRVYRYALDYIRDPFPIILCDHCGSTMRQGLRNRRYCNRTCQSRIYEKKVGGLSPMTNSGDAQAELLLLSKELGAAPIKNKPKLQNKITKLENIITVLQRKELKLAKAQHKQVEKQLLDAPPIMQPSLRDMVERLSADISKFEAAINNTKKG